MCCCLFVHCGTVLELDAIRFRAVSLHVCLTRRVVMPLFCKWNAWRLLHERTKYTAANNRLGCEWFHEGPPFSKEFTRQLTARVSCLPRNMVGMVRDFGEAQPSNSSIPNLRIESRVGSGLA